MSTHAGALLLAALAYTFARRYAEDPRFTFGTGKFGDLAGFSSALILAMIALLIGYEAVSRLFSPVPIHFAEAIPIAMLGLAGQYRQRLAPQRRRASSWHGMAMGMGTAMRTIATSRNRLRPGAAQSSSTCSRTGFRRVSGSTPKPDPRPPRRTSRSRR